VIVNPATVVALRNVIHAKERKLVRKTIPSSGEQIPAIGIGTSITFNIGKEIDSHDWASFLLKFIVTHPAVTCAIPATTRVYHMMKNMGAMLGVMYDAATRRRMIRYVEAL
jgi:diketogulonate reductase-like aldo/keto reductase